MRLQGSVWNGSAAVGEDLHTAGTAHPNAISRFTAKNGMHPTPNGQLHFFVAAPMFRRMRRIRLKPGSVYPAAFANVCSARTAAVGAVRGHVASGGIVDPPRRFVA